MFRITWRRLFTAIISITAVLVVLVATAGWYYSSQIEDGAFKIDREPDELNLEIVTVSEDRISFKHPSGEGRWEQPGLWGLEWEGGFGRVDGLVSIENGVAIREFVRIEGEPIPGTEARMTREVFRGDPLVAHGFAFDEVSFDGPLGPLGAWLVRAGDTWVIHVHGHKGDRIEALRSIPAVSQAGATSLVIDYRNDDGVAEDPSGYYLYGLTEWKDLEASVQYALDQGAKSVIPYGYSMGGAIVMSFMYNSPLADSVSAVVLDAPMLDLSRVIDQAAEQRGLPGFLTDVARFISEWRFDIEFDDLEYLDGAAELEAPILLFHGDDDDRIPVETSDDLAEARPELVTYERVPGAKHVHAWNLDTARYEDAVESFLAANGNP